MRDCYCEPQCVVVGIDGSRSAIQAALWAVDEAVDRNLPLRLLYAIDPVNSDSDDAAGKAIAAEHVIREAFSAIESTGKPVKMEAESIHCRPTTALLEESRSAAMVCLGSTGIEHAMQGRIGSTASALAASAHCPVAVVPTSTGPTPRQGAAILAVVDGSPASGAALELALDEARLRSAPLRVLTPPPTDTHDVGGPAAPDPSALAQLERRLDHCRRSHPDLDIQSVGTHGNLLNYLEHLIRTAEPIQLVVVDPRRPGPSDVLLGSSGRAALDAAGCTVLICDRQCWL